ncbi:vancomycin high temperature exclusion protein [Cryptosporangium sp. NPDC051539]|uniref:vancomycin high temperature exclusion protein n=1 Tax=Cryptosporangium sp. NPDC051539 TaxID=3363962 RepID=UPI0037943AB6
MGNVTDVSSAEDLAAAGRARQVRRRVIWTVAGLVTLGVLVFAGSAAWTWTASAGHRYASVAEAPEAPVAIVFGAQLRPDGTPKPFLAGRLDTAAELYRAGTVKAVLVSGDGSGTSGNETAAMARYLTARGLPAAKLVTDPSGLDTYDTCARAYRVYGVRRALLVSQEFHLPRAVALCRHVGIDADGVAGRCEDCRETTLWRNRFREIPADFKAVVDAARNRPPVVSSPPDPSVKKAVTS